jgi:hypothetical protein
MKILKNEHFTELIPENKYITNIEETEIMEGICGKDLNPADYKDITDEQAQEILNRLSKQYESEVNNDG